VISGEPANGNIRGACSTKSCKTCSAGYWLGVNGRHTPPASDPQIEDMPDANSRRPDHRQRRYTGLVRT
jgi:hypothetical protein